MGNLSTNNSIGHEIDRPLSNYKYWAFISYSHSDKKWGDWLHKALETYRVPRSIVGRQLDEYSIPNRVFPIFRDREELPTSASLSENIITALRQSRHLIVICSPRAVKSQWVNKEILDYKAMGRENRVLCLIVDGEPNASDKPDCEEPEAFPESIKYRVGPDGILTRERIEPIAADVRKNKDEKNNAKLKIIAGLLGIGYDELKQRDKQRHRRFLAFAGSAVAMLFLLVSGLAVFSFFQWQSADQQKRESHSLYLAALARDTIPINRNKALRIAQAAYEINPDNPPALVQNALLDVFYTLNNRFYIDLEGHTSKITSIDYSNYPLKILTSSTDGNAILWDTSGKILIRFKGHSAEIIKAIFTPYGQILTLSNDKTAKLWDEEGEELASFQFHIPENGFDEFDELEKQKQVENAYSLVNDKILLVSTPKVVTLFDKDGKEIQSYKTTQQKIVSVKLLPKGDKVLIEDEKKTSIWDLKGNLIGSFEGNQAQVSANEEHIVTYLEGASILWNLHGQRISTLKGIEPKISPDGTKVITRNKGGWPSADIWDLNGNSIASIDYGIWHDYEYYGSNKAYFANAERILTICEDTAKLWDTKGTLIGSFYHREWKGINSPIYIGPNAVLTFSEDGIAKIWSEKGVLLTSMNGHTDSILSAIYIDEFNSSNVITMSADATAKFWPEIMGKTEWNYKDETSQNFDSNTLYITENDWENRKISLYDYSKNFIYSYPYYGRTVNPKEIRVSTDGNKIAADFYRGRHLERESLVYLTPKGVYEWSKTPSAPKYNFSPEELKSLKIYAVRPHDTQVGEFMKAPTSAPVTEPKGAFNQKSNVILNVDLVALNISLADFPDEEGQVREWIQNVYSGYPAVITAVKQLMDGHKFKGNAVPLTIINANVLQLQGRETSQPIVDVSMIDRNSLKEALYLSWKEKNSGSILVSFEDIIE